MEIQLEFHPRNAERFGVRLQHGSEGEEETRIYFDGPRQEIVLDESRSSQNPNVRREIRSAPLMLTPGEPLKLHLFLDHSVIDGFFNGGKAFSSRIYPIMIADGLSVIGFAEGGEAKLSRFRAWEMRVSPQ
jgi:beta-fructofuranosidase